MKPAVARLVWSSVALFGIYFVLQFRPSGEAVPIQQPLDKFPAVVGEWRERARVFIGPEDLAVLKPTDYLVRRYEDPTGHSLLLYIGYWANQGKGVQPHSPKNCLPGSGWEPLEASLATIPLSAPFGSITVNRYLVQKDGEQQLVFYWYQSQGHAVAGELAARIDMMRNAIVNNRTDGALIRASVPVLANIRDSEQSLTRYVQAMYPILGQYLPS